MLQLDLDEELRPLHGMYGSTGAEDALSEVTKFYPPLKLRVSVDDITALLIHAPGLGESFGTGQYSSCGQRISLFQRKIVRVLCEYFEHQRRVQLE